MKCPNCQSENSDSAKFCKKCGNPLEVKTIDHESMITSISGGNGSGENNTTKIIIIALAVIAVVLAGAFIYIYSFSDSADAGSSNNALADKDTSQVNEKQETTAQHTEPEKTAKQPKQSMSILGGSFSTGSADSDKTYAEIYVGTEHAGENVIVQIWYSRDGSTLNNGNMVPASVHSDGYLYITSADAYKYYPDYATINLYDSNSNLMDSQSVSLSPTYGTQTF